MEFIIDFLTTESRNNIIMVVMDWLSKMAHFMPLRFSEGEASIIMVVKLLFDNIFKLYGLPKEIISDRDPWFTFNITHQLYHFAGIN